MIVSGCSVAALSDWIRIAPGASHPVASRKELEIILGYDEKYKPCKTLGKTFTFSQKH